jgi:hypothetical protein
MLPAMAGAGVLVLLWGLHYLAWKSEPPWFYASVYHAIGVNPNMLWSITDDYGTLVVFSDRRIFISWALACSFFVLGPLVALMLSKGKGAYIFSAALVLCVMTHGCWDIAYRVDDLIGFTDSPVTLANLDLFVWMAWPGVAWVFGLSLGGAAIGIALPRIVRAVAKRADRRKSPALE